MELDASRPSGMADYASTKRLAPEEIDVLLHGGTATSAGKPGVSSDEELPVTIELGRAELAPADALAITRASIVRLDKSNDDPVDVFVNQQLVAKGVMVVVRDELCVRILERVDLKLAKAG